MPASIGSPGSDGGVVKFWISGGGGSGSFSKRHSAGPSYQTTANLLEQFKIPPVTVMEYKKKASYERPRRVTWA